ncbi:MAG: NifB/NifX family molybdenum-iron cluster-binding protein [Candidatus Delongbacteria bacterium]|nr:NifB/NifX family molybdenum-iron cluster-binding protein [Candidatus Delongbacteria bacterium]MCG2761106.1 NifB/NifX family molybdenum-iron cluster-binding protein [Candidatus Delongbacteria bacterium]
MKKLFAVPTKSGKLCEHFGHCESFAVIEVDGSSVTRNEFITPPAHEPGLYPRFLAEMGVSTIIAGGMGQKAQDLFRQNNIEVFTGIGYEEPHKLVEAYLNKKLVSSENPCDHEDHGSHDCSH